MSDVNEPHVAENYEYVWYITVIHNVIYALNVELQ